MFQLVDSIESGEWEFDEFSAMIELMMIGVTKQNPSPGGPGQPPSHAEFPFPFPFLRVTTVATAGSLALF